VVLLLILTSCKRPISMSEADWELAQLGMSRKEYDMDMQRNTVYRDYIYNILYIGMSEPDFVRLFTKKDNEIQTNRPFIADHRKNQYIISILTGSFDDRSRLTFEDSKLVKYEEYGRGSNPLGYSNKNHMLQKQ